MVLESTGSVLILIALLQLKHFVADGPLQTREIVQGKGFYGNRLGLLHGGCHALGTLLALYAFSLSWAIIIALSILDGLVHYHVDYVKESTVRKAGWTFSDAKFWWAMMLDQLVHNLTYLAIAALALRLA